MPGVVSPGGHRSLEGGGLFADSCLGQRVTSFLDKFSQIDFVKVRRGKSRFQTVTEVAVHAVLCCDYGMTRSQSQA